MNGYETEELRDRHLAALVKKLQQARAAGNKELEEACLRDLAGTAHAARSPVERAEKRPSARRSERRDAAPKED